MKLRALRKLQESTIETILPMLRTSNEFQGMTNGPLLRNCYDFLITAMNTNHEDDNDLFEALEDCFVYLDHSLSNESENLKVNYEVIEGVEPMIHVEIVRDERFKLMEIQMTAATLRLMARKRKLEIGS